MRKTCQECSAPLTQPETGRPRKYCSDLCRWRAWRRRDKRQPKGRPSRWHTPTEIREQVLARWPVTLDAAAEADSALVPDYLGPDHPDPVRRDALAFDDWIAFAGEGTVYLNPPYTPAPLLRNFLTRAAATAEGGVRVVGLVPASTGSAWWWDCVVAPAAHVEFLRGRLAFEGPHSKPGMAAPWPSALVVWEPRQVKRRRGTR